VLLVLNQSEFYGYFSKFSAVREALRLLSAVRLSTVLAA
jgi:hypothetical protein